MAEMEAEDVDEDASVPDASTTDGHEQNPSGGQALTAQPEYASEDEAPLDAFTAPTSKSRKRPFEGVDRSAAVAKKVKENYHEEYREFFNSTISHSDISELLRGPPAMEPSQLGCVEWSANEKALFFEALARLGQNSTKQIASAVHTKSEVEVTEYLQQLRDSTYRANELKKFRVIEEQEVPFAFELSDPCCAALDDAAEGLRQHELRLDMDREYRRFGEYYILDEDIAARIESTTSNDDENTEAASSNDSANLPPLPENLVASTEFFDLSNWLELSRQIFMNRASPNEEDHWVNVTDGDETPSIFATAFNDFYNLAVNYVKRLVQVSLFQTMSRLRAGDWPGSRKNKFYVRRGDVLAALDILNISHDSRPFWVGAARRLQLKVYNPAVQLDRVLSAKDLGDELSYDDVEQFLNDERDDFEQHVPQPTVEQLEEQSSPRSTNQEIEQDDSKLQTSDPVDLESDSASSGKGTADTHEQEVIDNELDRLDSEDEKKIRSGSLKDTYIEAVDNRDSIKEEQRLWKLLNKNPPGNPMLESGVLPFPRKPRHIRFHRYPGESDWRDNVDFRSEWERYGHLLPEGDFSSRGMVISQRIEEDKDDDDEFDRKVEDNETSSSDEGASSSSPVLLNRSDRSGRRRSSSDSRARASTRSSRRSSSHVSLSSGEGASTSARRSLRGRRRASVSYNPGPFQGLERAEDEISTRSEADDDGYLDADMLDEESHREE